MWRIADTSEKKWMKFFVTRWYDLLTSSGIDSQTLAEVSESVVRAPASLELVRDDKEANGAG